MAKMWRTPPSQLVGIQNDLTAYYFNRAIMLFGSTMEDELKQAGKKAKTDRGAQMKAQMVYNRWMTMPGDSLVGKFRDPMGIAKKSTPPPAPDVAKDGEKDS